MWLNVKCLAVVVFIIVLPAWLSAVYFATNFGAKHVTLGRVCLVLLFGTIIGAWSVHLMMDRAVDNTLLSVNPLIIPVPGAFALLLAFRFLLKSTWVYAMLLAMVVLVLLIFFAISGAGVFCI